MFSVRHNWVAIAVAWLVYFVLGGLWFTVLKAPWLVGVGRTEAQIMAVGVSSAVTYGSAALTTLVLAVFLSWVIQATGAPTAARGVKVAGLVWLGAIFTTWSTEYAFEARSLEGLAITTGYCLVGMVLMGAILGGWKKRA